MVDGSGELFVPPLPLQDLLPDRRLVLVVETMQSKQTLDLEGEEKSVTHSSWLSHRNKKQPDVTGSGAF